MDSSDIMVGSLYAFPSHRLSKMHLVFQACMLALPKNYSRNQTPTEIHAKHSAKPVYKINMMLLVLRFIILQVLFLRNKIGEFL